MYNVVPIKSIGDCNVICNGSTCSPLNYRMFATGRGNKLYCVTSKVTSVASNGWINRLHCPCSVDTSASPSTRFLIATVDQRWPPTSMYCTLITLITSECPSTDPPHSSASSSMKHTERCRQQSDTHASSIDFRAAEQQRYAHRSPSVSRRPQVNNGIETANRRPAKHCHCRARITANHRPPTTHPRRLSGGLYEYR